MSTIADEFKNNFILLNLILKKEKKLKIDKYILIKILKLSLKHSMFEKLLKQPRSMNALNFNDLTEDIIISYMNRDGILLKYVENQTENICLTAVKNNYEALEYVKNQTEKICFIAIKENINALDLVNIYSDNILIEAMKKGNHSNYCLSYYFKFKGDKISNKLVFKLIANNVKLQLHFDKNKNGSYLKCEGYKCNKNIYIETLSQYDEVIDEIVKETMEKKIEHKIEQKKLK